MSVSKLAWVVPHHFTYVNGNTAVFDQVLTAVQPCLRRCLETDKGKELFYLEFAALMKRHNIQNFSSESEQKAAVVKQFNRTIKTKIKTYLSDSVTVR